MTSQQTQDLKTIGLRIRRARTDRKWSQLDLARQIRASNTDISRFEAGILAIGEVRARRLEAVLGIPWHELVAPSRRALTSLDQPPTAPVSAPVPTPAGTGAAPLTKGALE